jgi:four helix bundle protein
MGDVVFRFQKLDIYQLALDLVKDSYSLTRTFPAEERFALVPQMNRAVVSVPSNIAEGISRGTRKDQVHFLNISYGSLMELACQSDISCMLEYITDRQRKELSAKINNLAIKINNFISYIRKEIKQDV